MAATQGGNVPAAAESAGGEAARFVKDAYEVRDYTAAAKAAAGNRENEPKPLISANSELAKLIVIPFIVDKVFAGDKINEDITGFLALAYPKTDEETLRKYAEGIKWFVGWKRRYDYVVARLKQQVKAAGILPEDAPIVAEEGEFARENPEERKRSPDGEYQVRYTPYKYLEYDRGALGEPVRMRDKNYVPQNYNTDEMVLALLEFDLVRFYRAWQKIPAYYDESGEKPVDLGAGVQARILLENSKLGDKKKIRGVIDVVLPRGLYLNGDYLNPNAKPGFVLAEGAEAGDNVAGYELFYPLASGVVKDGVARRVLAGRVRFPIEFERADASKGMKIAGTFGFELCSAKGECRPVLSSHELTMKASDETETSIYANYVWQGFAHLPAAQSKHARVESATYDPAAKTLSVRFATTRAFSNVAVMAEDAAGTNFLNPRYRLEGDAVVATFDVQAVGKHSHIARWKPVPKSSRTSMYAPVLGRTSDDSTALSHSLGVAGTSAVLSQNFPPLASGATGESEDGQGRTSDDSAALSRSLGAAGTSAALSQNFPPLASGAARENAGGRTADDSTALSHSLGAAGKEAGANEVSNAAAGGVNQKATAGAMEGETGTKGKPDTVGNGQEENAGRTARGDGDGMEQAVADMKTEGKGQILADTGIGGLEPGRATDRNTAAGDAAAGRVDAVSWGEIAISASFDDEEFLRTVVPLAVPGNGISGAGDYRAVFGDNGGWAPSLALAFGFGFLLNLMPGVFYLFLRLARLFAEKPERWRIFARYAAGTALGLALLGAGLAGRRFWVLYENPWLLTAAAMVALSFAAEALGYMDFALFRPFKREVKRGVFIGAFSVLLAAVFPMPLKAEILGEWFNSGTQYVVLSLFFVWLGMLALPLAALLRHGRQTFWLTGLKRFNGFYNLAYVCGILWIVAAGFGAGALLALALGLAGMGTLWYWYPVAVAETVKHARSETRQAALFYKVQKHGAAAAALLYLLTSGAVALSGLRQVSPAPYETVRALATANAAAGKPTVVAVEAGWSPLSLFNRRVYSQLRDTGMTVIELNLADEAGALPWLEAYGRGYPPLAVLFTARHPQGLVLPEKIGGVDFSRAVSGW